jgi:hypothetical protein
MGVAISTANRDLSFKVLIGNQLFVHINCTKKLLITSNTFGCDRNANESKSKNCRVMVERVQTIHNFVMAWWIGSKYLIAFDFGVVSEPMSCLGPSLHILCTKLNEHIIHYRNHDYG